MDNKLCVNPSTRSTLVMEGKLPRLMVTEPMILPLWSPPNLTSPPCLSTRSWNVDLLPVMCREHPESRYHDILLFVLFAAKDICNRNYLLLRYPQFLGSFLVKSPQQKIFNRRNNMIFFRFVSMIFLRMCHMLLGVNSVKLLCMCFFSFKFKLLLQLFVFDTKMSLEFQKFC